MKESTLFILNEFLKENPKFEYLKQNLIDAVQLLTDCAKSNHQILICGNGGSAADSEHIAGELLKSFVKKRCVEGELKNSLVREYGEEGEEIASNLQQGIKCIPLTSFCAYNTAFLNDCNEKMLFAQLVNVLGDKGDVLIGISTSGNSKNVLFAEKLAKVKGLKVISLTGQSGGKMKEFSDVLLNANSTETYKIQEWHLPIYHQLCLCVENEMFEF